MRNRQLKGGQSNCDREGKDKEKTGEEKNRKRMITKICSSRNKGLCLWELCLQKVNLVITQQKVIDAKRENNETALS